MLDLFSISAMFILFRETLEACIIVSVMLQLCVKLKLLQLRIWGEHHVLSMSAVVAYASLHQGLTSISEFSTYTRALGCTRLLQRLSILQ